VRLRLVLVIVTAALGGSGAIARELLRVGVHQGYAPEQPIAFSHKLHAGDAKVPCLYCHFGARTSRHAGIPPANVCMNCHAILTKQTVELEKLKEAIEQRRPIAWIKVHNLPDFVAFNHSRHLVAGVECRSCHGAIASMVRVEQQAPLTMGWCVECHRSRRRDRSVPADNLECGKCHY
jgi:hypothetical protein